MQADPSPPLTISVIIPTWNERPLIADAVEHAHKLGNEVIVVDGGSTDGTADAAKSAGADVIVAPKGRGNQLRAGAERARGDVLLFLHADARLPPSARGAIKHAMLDLTRYPVPVLSISSTAVLVRRNASPTLRAFG